MALGAQQGQVQGMVLKEGALMALAALAAVVAACLPARRATRVDPMEALRSEG